MFLKSLLCSPSLHLFDQKYSKKHKKKHCNIVKYFYMF